MKKVPKPNVQRPDEIERAQRPGYLWEWVDDVCLVCEARIGRQLRFLASRLCATCAKAPKH